MKKTAYADLGNEDQSLLRAAVDVMSNAYAPYSGFWVGAAVRSKSGKIYRGSNMENASYGLTVCAEVAALSCANSARDLPTEAIAVVGGKASSTGQVIAAGVVTPCGRCRQLIAEAGQIAGGDVRVLAGNSDLSQILAGTVKELLPHAFGADALKASDGG